MSDNTKYNKVSGWFGQWPSTGWLVFTALMGASSMSIADEPEDNNWFEVRPVTMIRCIEFQIGIIPSRPGVKVVMLQCEYPSVIKSEEEDSDSETTL